MFLQNKAQTKQTEFEHLETSINVNNRLISELTSSVSQKESEAIQKANEVLQLSQEVTTLSLPITELLWAVAFRLQLLPPACLSPGDYLLAGSRAPGQPGEQGPKLAV
jgi:hypothetical protein